MYDLEKIKNDNDNYAREKMKALIVIRGAKQDTIPNITELAHALNPNVDNRLISGWKDKKVSPLYRPRLCDMYQIPAELFDIESNREWCEKLEQLQREEISGMPAGWETVKALSPFIVSELETRIVSELETRIVEDNSYGRGPEGPAPELAIQNEEQPHRNSEGPILQQIIAPGRFQIRVKSPMDGASRAWRGWSVYPINENRETKELTHLLAIRNERLVIPKIDDRGELVFPSSNGLVVDARDSGLNAIHLLMVAPEISLPDGFNERLVANTIGHQVLTALTSVAGTLVSAAQDRKVIVRSLPYEVI